MAAAVQETSVTAAAPDVAAASSMPRVLMLHGWTQNADVFSGRTGAFKRKLAKAVECVYATAPHLLPPGPAGDRENARAWWGYDPDRVTAPADVFSKARRQYKGWEDSRRYLADLWRSQGPFVGVVGFSQGAVACHQLLVELQLCQGAPAEPDGGDSLRAELAPILAQPPRFAVLACGFPSRHVIAPRDCAPLLATPSLHISSPRDTTVPPVLQQELAGCFASPAWLRHDHGHAMPQRADDLRAVLTFIAPFLPTGSDGPAPAGAAAPAKQTRAGAAVAAVVAGAAAKPERADTDAGAGPCELAQAQAEAVPPDTPTPRC